MNNVLLNWKIISKVIPGGAQNANDRIPTIDEILEVLKYPDRRIKPVSYTMISSGIRISAWDYLKWKHIIPINNKSNERNSAQFNPKFLFCRKRQVRVRWY